MNKNNLKNQLIEDISDSDNDNSGFVLGTISAILLVICIGTLLMFNNKQVQRIITDKINIDSANNVENKNSKFYSCRVCFFFFLIIMYLCSVIFILNLSNNLA